MRVRQALTVIVLIPITLSSQVSWNGIYDFEIKKGASGSSKDKNGLPNGFLQFNVANLQLFIDADVGDGVMISGKIATDRRGGFDARAVQLELAYVTFLGLAGDALNISFGKILTPFGTFARRQLSPDNPVIGNPLFFDYQTNVSPVSGYLDSSGVLLAGALYGGRLATIYTGGYYVGAEVFGGLLDDLLQYDIAAMNAPLSAPNSGMNLDKQLSFHGRISAQPAIWTTIGASYCVGSFLERGDVNSFLDKSGSVEQFRQRTIGLDFTINYLFYEVTAEYVMNRFNAPFVVYDFTIVPPYRSGLIGKDEIILTNDELLIDAKIDAPFYPGLYIAGRFDMLTFGKLTDPSSASSTSGKEIPWDNNVQRYAVAFGYKPFRNVLAKFGYEWTVIDMTPRPDLDVIATQVSVSF